MYLSNMITLTTRDHDTLPSVFDRSLIYIFKEYLGTVIMYCFSTSTVFIKSYKFTHIFRNENFIFILNKFKNYSINHTTDAFLIILLKFINICRYFFFFLLPIHRIIEVKTSVSFKQI